MKDIFKIAKIVYNVNSIDKIPIEVLIALEDTNNLYKKAGGRLKSYSAISNIIVCTDKLRRYSPESSYYVGNR